MVRFEASFRDINREARRSAMATSNGVSVRRQRSSLMRESLDNGLAETNEVVKLRGRAKKRERGRNSSSRGKTRRSKRFSKRKEVDEEEESSVDTLVGEEIPQNTASFPKSLRKNFPLGRVSRQAAALSLKVANEMISFQVPRKARSACVKRSHDCRTSSGNGGFVEEFRLDSASPASQSFEAGSPFSSNDPEKEWMKPNAPKSRLLKSSRPSSQSRDELEIEIAEVLSGLKKQSQSSKEEDNVAQSLTSSEFKDAIVVNHDVDFISSVKKMKIEGGDSLAPTQNSSNAPAIDIQVKVSTDKSEEIDLIEPQDEAVKQKILKLSAVEESGRRDIVENEERFNSQITVTKGILEVPGVENRCEDTTTKNDPLVHLMAPPSTSSILKRESSTLASDSKLITDMSKMEYLWKHGEVSTIKAMVMVGDGKKIENQALLKLDQKNPDQDYGRAIISNGFHCHGQRQQQPAQAWAPKLEKLAKPSSMPLPMDGWPIRLPPPGYMPPVQTLKPTEGFTETLTVQKPAQFIASQLRPKRCATHYYIARNIQLHQQFVKTNQACPTSTSSFSFGCGDVGPNNLYVMPPPCAESLIPGNQVFQGSFPTLNLKYSAQDNGRKSADISIQKAGIAETSQKTPQSSAAVGNLQPSQAFIYPISHHQEPVSAARIQTAPSKSVTFSGSPTMASIPSSVSFNFPTPVTNGYPFQPSNIPGKALPYFNGPYYSTRMFNSLQLQQQHAQREKISSCDSASSHKQLHTPVNSKYCVSSSLIMPKQHLSSSSHQSHNLEASFNLEKSVNGQSMTAALQPLNFSMSFGPMKENGSSSNLNFLSNGHYIVPVPQRSDSKIGEGDKGVLGKPPALPSGKTLVFDNSAKTLDFHSGNWPRPISASTTISSSLVSTVLPSTNQQLQIQKYNSSEEQQQQSAWSKSTATNKTWSASSNAAKFTNNIPVYTHQADAQANLAASQPAQWNSPATSSSLTTRSSLNLKQFQQQNMVTAHGGQTQISFAWNSNHGLPKLPSSCPSQSQSRASPATGSPPDGKTNSVGINKTGSSVVAIQTQQAEDSVCESGQKPSPVCERNVLSINSSCPSHLSELKH